MSAVPHPRQRRLAALLAVVVLAAGTALLLVELSLLLGPGFPGNDFTVLWSAGRFAAQQPAAQVYDAAALQAFRHGLGGTLSSSPFLYPPPDLLLLVPLAQLPLPAAVALWNGATLGLALLSAALALRPQRWLWLALPMAPAALITLAAGQTGFLEAALALGGAQLLWRRPAWGGALLGLLAFKPQLALLPLLLLPFAPRPGAAVAGAGAILLGLLLASLAAFGVDPWLAWLHTVHDFGGGVASSAAHQRYGASIAFAALDLGLAAPLAKALQAAAALAALAGTAWSLLRATPPLASASLLCGMFLATPYAALYDLPAASLACLLLAAQGWHDGFRRGEVAVLLAAWCAPLLALAPWPWVHPSVLTVAALAALFVMLLRRAGAAQAAALS